MEHTAEYQALSYLEKQYADDMLKSLNQIEDIPDLLFTISCVQLDNDMVDKGRKVALNHYMSQHVTF